MSTEALLLDAVDNPIITPVYDRMVGVFPRLFTMTHCQQARTREYVRWMARFTAGALLTDDASMVEDLLTWLCGLLREMVPASVITTSARLLSDTLEPQAASGADILRPVRSRAT